MVGGQTKYAFIMIDEADSGLLFGDRGVIRGHEADRGLKHKVG
jgi:hypothetical protein